MGVPAQHVQGLGRAPGHPGGGAQGAAQLAHHPGGREPVAHHVTDRDTDAVAAHQVDEVVPVPAHVQRADRGPVAHGGPVVQRLPAGGQHRLLEGQRDLALTGVGPPQPFVDLLEFTGAGVQLGLQDPVPVRRSGRRGPGSAR